MGRYGIAILLLFWGFPAANAWSQTVHYPRVYGATGHLSGPTQANYQYQRQYGHPWNGQGGITANLNTYGGSYFVNGYPGSYNLSYGSNAYSYFGAVGVGYGGMYYAPGYSPFPTYTAAVPPVLYGYPSVFANSPLNNPGLTAPLNPNPLGLNPLFNANPIPNANPLPPISSAEAKLKSVRAQAQGDIWFQQQEFHKAFDRYKAAVAEAQDRGEAHLRLAVCYAALGHLDLAARQLKRGIEVDPQFTAKADSLGKIYGPGNAIAQSAMVNKATLWAKEDIRDPERLFLLGALLYLQGDDRAPILLETGMALAGGGEHFRSLLAAAPIELPQPAPAGGQNSAPQVIDQAPAPQPANPVNPNGGVLPPLPAPATGDAPQNSLPAGPELSLPTQ
jgi:tetratricopeptide (TPR) repeat protein